MHIKNGKELVYDSLAVCTHQLSLSLQGCVAGIPQVSI
jgi:hypothetical protein